MTDLLVNSDVGELEPAVEFYTKGFGLQLSRRLGPNIAELWGAKLHEFEWRRYFVMADSFRNGFCLLEFKGRGYSSDSPEHRGRSTHSRARF